MTEAAAARTAGVQQGGGHHGAARQGTPRSGALHQDTPIAGAGRQDDRHQDVPGAAAEAPAGRSGRARPAPEWSSVLYPAARPNEETTEEPAYFPDLNLDQLVGALCERYGEYRLEPFFYAKLDDPDSVRYRQEVFEDLRDPEVLGAVRGFCEAMRTARGHLLHAEKVHYAQPRQAWFLEAVSTYCTAVEDLSANLSAAGLVSRGLQGFQRWLQGHVSSRRFAELRSAAGEVHDRLASIVYTLRVNGGRVTVRRYDDRPDYSAEVLECFAKFAQGRVRDYRAKFREEPDLNHVEAAVVDMVARLYPEELRRLGEFFVRHQEFVDPVLEAFDREINFYLAYLEHISALEGAGLPFCRPEVSDVTKEVSGRDTFDIALATRLVPASRQVVTNDFELNGDERVIVVSGPNQGGKTTFARTFAQLHHLACLGCPVPGSAARLLLYDQMFTHFEREENLANLTGKLEDDLLRIQDILLHATGSSVVVINEIFSSTTVDDARFLSEKVMAKVVELGVLCVMVSFIHELAEIAPSAVSMVSTVDPDDPARRTYKVVRRRADGLTYAAVLARRHGLTYDELKRTIGR